ncbi:MAG: hypothetical protein ACOYK9_02590 [Chlamydiia bacterium]
MMVKLPYGYFMEESVKVPDWDTSIKKTIEKIKRVANQGLCTDELVIHLRKTESLSSVQRQEIARIRNKMEEDPFPEYDDLQRGDVAEELYEMLQLILEQRLLEFIQHLEALPSEIKWPLYQEIELAGGDLVRLVKAIDIQIIQEQKIPITQALAQLAEITVTHGARSPYLTLEEIHQMEQDFIDLREE